MNYPYRPIGADFTSACPLRVKKKPTFMRFTDITLRIVGFIAEAHNYGEVEYDHCGTGFNVIYRSEKTGLAYPYIVTCRHVVENLKGRPSVFLVNKTGGGITPIDDNDGKDWRFHPTNKESDVAIRPFQYDPSIHDIKSFPTTEFVTREILGGTLIGPGDEVGIMGLFSPNPGRIRNEPLVRTGNIAMIPEEPIQTNRGFCDAYLIEARSIGGLSGSPVFVNELAVATLLDEQGNEFQHAISGGRLRLLGMAQTHWDINERDINEYRIIQDMPRGVNMGIAIISPAIQIAETLNHPDFIAHREYRDNEHLARFRPVED